MVIQEAFACGKPVIAANIGGMAEKVEDGVTGLHFEARNAFDLADKLSSIANNDSIRTRISAGIRIPSSYEKTAARYISLDEVG